ncbi:hypothetical protein PROFUN_16521, partial [Planoprotostelium fungivorum]
MDFATVQERDHKNIRTPTKTMAQPFKEKPSYREPCPLPNHTLPKSECRELKRQERSNFSSPTQPSDTQTKRTFDINSVTCNYCLDKGHYANKCPKRTTTQPSNQPDKPKDSKLRAIRSKPPAETAEEASDYSAVNTYVASMVPGYRLMVTAGIADGEDYADLFIECLPGYIKSTIHSAIHQRTNVDPNTAYLRTVAEVMDFATVQERDHKNIRTPTKTMAQPFKEKPSYREPCPLPNHTHPKSECRELKRQERSNFSSPTQPSDTQTKRTFDINSVTCNYCLDKGHYANKCPKRTTTQPSNQPDKPKDSKLRAIRSKPPAETAEEASDYSAVDTYVASMVPGYRLRSLHVDPLNTQRFHVPILINNIRFRALLDSGADGSYINCKTAEAHNIPWTPTPGRVTLAGEGQAMDRYGLTDPLAVQYGNPGNVSNCLLTFHVVDLEGPEIFIGGDNFHLINVSVTNLATKWPTDEPSTLNTTVIVPELDSDTNDAAFPPEEHELFMEQIKPALDANAALPATAICTLPEAIINIETPEGCASYRPQYKIPERQKPAVDAQINKWIEQVVIKEAPVDIRWNNALLTVPKPDGRVRVCIDPRPINMVSQDDKWNNALLTVPKPDGRVRVCIDPRPINMVSQDDKYPLPDANELLRRMKGACIFSTLDCTDAYHSLPIAEKDQHKTAFTWNGKMYVFVRAPFGFKQIPGKFQRVMHIIFRNTHFVIIYMDDITVYSFNLEHHSEHVCHTINLLTENGFRLNITKCKWALTHITFLGHIVDAVGSRVNPAKLADCENWPKPTTGKHIQQFLGFVNYWRDNIPLLSSLTSRLDALRNEKDITHLWTIDHDEDYNRILAILRNAYHSLPIAEKDQHKTAFTWNGKMYVFVRAPFGFKQIPGKFQRVMHIIFRNTHFVIIYMDDITVYSFNLEHHSEHVCHTINLLTENGFRLNITKCKWALTRITFLGHIVDAVGSRVNPAKLANCENWPKPTTGKHIQQFLGFVNYWRDNIPLLSSLTSRLDALRNEKDITHLWTIDHDEDYNRILAILRSGTMLHHAGFNYPFFGASDASGTGIGGCVYQIIEGTTRYLLALIYVIRKGRNYFYGAHFEFYTDHAALTYIHSQPKLHPMVIAWFDELAEYNFTINHRPGILNILPDTLSRLYPDANRQYYILNRRVKITPDKSATIVETEDDQLKMLEEKHLLGHFGTTAMINAVRAAGYNWPQITEQASEIVRSCSKCQQFNIVRREANRQYYVVNCRVKIAPDKHDEDYNRILAILRSGTMLHHADFNYPFFGASDASGTGIGGCIYQIIDGTTRYILFCSRSLTPAERNYSATKRELLALIYVIRKGRNYFYGAHFEFYTDHAALTYIHSQPKLHPMVIAWFDELAEYNFTINHRPGILNILPDTLSRLYPEANRQYYVVNRRVKIAPDSTTTIMEEKDDQLKMLEEKHLLGHFGATAMINAVRAAGYNWPQITEQATEIVRSCAKCQQFNIVRRGYHPTRPILSKMPGDHLAIDLAGPLPTTDRGNNYLFIAVDICTRFFSTIKNPLARVITTTTTSLARVITTHWCATNNYPLPGLSLPYNTLQKRRRISENSATKKHIQCMFIEKEHLGFLWFEIILYKQRLIELFGSYVVTIHHKAQRITYQWFLDLDIPKPSTISMIITSSLPHTGPSIAKGCSLTGSRTRGSRVRVLD